MMRIMMTRIECFENPFQPIFNFIQPKDILFHVLPTFCITSVKYMLILI